METSITTALGAGSGIDINALVTSLVEAQFANKNQQLTKQSEKLTTQISGVSTLKSGITGFSTALSNLVKGGTLATAPTSSNSSILNVTRLAGGKLAGLSASLEVRQLAAAQVATSPPVPDPIASVGRGSFTLTFGNATVVDGAMTDFTAGTGTPISIPITAGNSGLSGIARAINGANAGVTAIVLTDADGSRLSIKGATGEAKAFTLTATEDPDAPGLSSLNIGPNAANTTIGSVAKDAIVAIDGTALKRASNSISDIIAGVKIDLVSAQVGTRVTLGTTAPTDALTQAVSDFVDTYNQFSTVLAEQTNNITGALKNDAAAITLQRSLRGLTLTSLITNAADGVPTTLAEIGVSTNRDGTLSVDSARLATAMAKWPDTIEAMFADGKGASGAGIGAALATISSNAVDQKVTVDGKTVSLGFAASTATYTRAQTKLSVDQSDVVDETDKLTTRLKAQYSAMDARVAAYKSTLTFVQQQVDAWNSSNN